MSQQDNKPYGMSYTPRFFHLLVAALAISPTMSAQDIEWRHYNSSNSDLPANTIPCIETDNSGRKWIGTAHGGLVLADGNDWTIYNTGNSGIPDNYVNAIAFAPDNFTWVGTGGSGAYGLAKFDGSTWLSYTSGNSPIPVGNTQAVAVDATGHVWIGSMFCSGGGLISIQGAEWVEFTQGNSELPDNWIRDIVTQGNVVWIATYGHGLARYDGTWTIFNTSNSNIPSNYLKSMAFDQGERLWVATQHGLASFDGADWITVNNLEANAVEVAPNGDVWVGYDGDGVARLHDGEWTSFTKTTSPLAEDFILSIAADAYGEVWVGTMTKGISVLTVEGTAVASAVDELSGPEHNVFPVPATDKFVVSISENSTDAYRFEMFDLTGRLVLAAPLHAGPNPINISTLARGHHVYSVSSTNGRTSSGVVILQ